MKVCLISPYWGTNLGDAAIQDAVIYNVRRRYPDAEICLISLDPEYTSRLHKVASFPITALQINHYSHGYSQHKTNPSNASVHDIEDSSESDTGILVQIKTVLKKIPALFHTIKAVYLLFLGVVKMPRIFFQEVTHFSDGRNFIKGADLLIVSGGGQLDDYWGGAWGHPYSLLKWAIIAKTRNVRYLFLGVGTCTFESKLSRIFIRQALKMASYRSYRDQKSKMLLETMSFTRNDQVGPDLAFSHDRSQLVLADSTGSPEAIVGVSPIIYLHRKWPKADSQVYSHYLENIAKFVVALVEQGYAVHLFTTDDSDRHGVKEILDLIAQENKAEISNKISWINTGTTEELFACLSRVSYVVASRLHGVILGHLMQKPVLAISYDRKVDTHMKDAGFSDYCIDIHSADLGSMKRTFDSLIAHSQIVTSALKVMNENYSHQLDLQYDHVLGASNE